jgi:hypothetical protein
VKAIVRQGLIPSRLETCWCRRHTVVMQPWQTPGAPGTATSSRTAPGAPARPRPPAWTPRHSRHTRGGPDKPLAYPRTPPGLDGHCRLGYPRADPVRALPPLLSVLPHPAARIAR